MKTTLFSLLFCLAFVFSVFAENTQKDAKSVKVFQPVAVQKNIKQKIYVHLMPWFETKETNRHPKYPGKWGIHYTMGNKNPDIIVDKATGRREVAMYYYPLTGPYASGNKDIVEYQLLLMKLSGIDGVFIDWPPVITTEDYPMLISNAEKVIALLDKVGLDFAIVYEDQDINVALNNKAIENKVEAAQKDMEYLSKNYFNRPNYIRYENKPLLLNFGPQTFQTVQEWTEVFSKMGDNKPAFFTLWYQSNKAGANATGEFSWIWKDNIAGLNHFYNEYPFSGKKIASAYPGFSSFYVDGGWGAPGTGYTIPYRGDSTFVETLQLAFKSKLDMIQLVTWNDYGEGTMIEPTVEFGYTFLTTLQKQLGVKYTQADLELIFRMYNLRKQYADSPAVQAKLNQAFNYVVSLQMDKAKKLLNGISLKK
jgi:hypothetical protein